MKKILLILITLLPTLVLLSCNSSNETTNAMPDMGVKANNWNTSLKLVDDPILANTYKNGSGLDLRIENLSNTSIVFPDDFGIRIISWDGNTWENVSNNFYYTYSEVLPTKKSYPLGLILNALPYIPNLSSSIDIRVVIIGHPENNDKELVGAYLDITLIP